MRIVMYTENYEPIAILDVERSDVQVLRRHAGDHIRMHAPAMMNYRAVRPSDRIQQTMPVYQGMVLVEGMRWADGETREILVVRGRDLCRHLLEEGAHRDDLEHRALTAFGVAVEVARRRGARYGDHASDAMMYVGRRNSTATEMRMRMEMARPPVMRVDPQQINERLLEELMRAPPQFVTPALNPEWGASSVLGQVNGTARSLAASWSRQTQDAMNEQRRPHDDIPSAAPTPNPDVEG